MHREPCVYLLAKASHSTLYTGVTSNLIQRIHQHRAGTIKGFTERFGIKRLVWFEAHETMETAIVREKQIKGGSRPKKIALIEMLNSDWDDLYDSIAHG